MKTAHDPRHQTRVKAVQGLFAESFTTQPKKDALAKEVYSKSQKLDKLIEEAAPAWPIDKLNKIDLAILRLATFELRYTDTPPKVIIDEAVEIAKKFGSDNSASFVNGVLGNIYSKYYQTDNENE